MTTDPISPAPAHWNALKPVSNSQQYVSVSVSRTAAPCARQTERERCPASPGAPVIWFNISIMLRPTRLLLLLPTNLDSSKFDYGPRSAWRTGNSQQSDIAGGYKAIPLSYSFPYSLPNQQVVKVQRGRDLVSENQTSCP